MKVVVLAYHDIGCEGINALLRNGFEIAAVFTHKDDPNENVWFNSVAELSASKNIPVFAPENINHPLWVRKIEEYKPDVIFSFYYRNIIKQSILNIPPRGCLNLHGSLLPKYRGRCPINWVLVNGEKETGATLHYMTPKPDDGDIVCRKKIAITTDDTAKSLHEKASRAASIMLDEILPQIKDGTAPREPQDHSIATYYGGLRPEDGEIDWTAGAGRISDLVRAVTQPYPGAFSYIVNQKCVFWAVSEEAYSGKELNPGTIVSIDPLFVVCGKGAVRVDYGQADNGLYMTGT